MDKYELVRLCCDWQVSNVQYESWVKKLEKELNKMGQGHIWQNPVKNEEEQSM
jgi:hypothetical protein